MPMSVSWLFDLRGNLTSRQAWALGILGIAAIVGVWIALTTGAEPIIPRQSLPHPSRVITAYGDLYRDNELFHHIAMSLALNLGGYIKAILWGIPLGFLIGLLPLFKGMAQSQVDAVRFLPLTALIQLFIIWFGIGSEMKINFLAFGIFIYLLPTMVMRVQEVDDVYVKTVHTIGASKWQTFRTVFFPAVVSRIIDDIRVLTAISWTYIIIIEITGSQGGLGQLIYSAGQRMGRVDKIFAVLIIILIIGVLQDRLFGYLDRKFFPHKYQADKGYHQDAGLKKVNLWSIITDFTIQIFGYIFLALYLVLALNEWFGFLGSIRPFDYFFGDRQWVIHTIGLLIVAYQASNLYRRFIYKSAN